MKRANAFIGASEEENDASSRSKRRIRVLRIRVAGEKKSE